jgi:hypothetical protein
MFPLKLLINYPAKDLVTENNLKLLDKEVEYERSIVSFFCVCDAF